MRESLRVDFTFGLESSLLIRSGSGGAKSPDFVHLHSRRGDSEKPVLSGASLAGAIRARALRIANTVLPEGQGPDLINAMFGKRIGSHKDKPSGSRVITHETALNGKTNEMVQSRVKIDRFTGGAFPTALFTEQPLFGENGPHGRISFELRSPQDAEIGLLLLLLKDLWTGDLPLGGESSVGRGRLKGIEAELARRRNGELTTWKITQQNGNLELTGNGSEEDLERFVQALHRYGRDS